MNNNSRTHLTIQQSKMIKIVQYIIILWLSNQCHSFRRLANSREQNSDWFPSLYSQNLTNSQYDDVYNTPHRLLSDFNAENHLIQTLPGLSDSMKHYAGHITVDESKNSNIFYWLFEAPNDADKLPLLVWLNGGPGCSSMDGLWLELGPLRLDQYGKVVSINKHSWHNVANLLFIDQPVGTGYSYTKSRSGYATNDYMVNVQFYKFMQEFFRLHPRYVQTQTVNGRSVSRPYFMSGESHAGHYIPSMASFIMNKNDIIRNTASDDVIISIEGIALGNPWLDPFHQYDASDFAHGLGIINQGQKHRLKELEKKCHALLKNGKYNTAACFSLLDKVVDATAVGGSERVLMYDTRKYVRQTSSFPPGHETLERYLNRPEVRQALHATSSPNKFEECANPPFNALSHQDGKGVVTELVDVLDRGLRVLVFAGQYDLICNHLGVEKVLRGVRWQHQHDWLLAQPGNWAPQGRPLGFIRAYKNLEFLIVLDAGHMVPMDQPAVALDMIGTFLQDRRFSTGQAKLGVAFGGPEEDPERCPRFEGVGNGSDPHRVAKKPSTSLISGLGFWRGAQRGQHMHKIRSDQRSYIKQHRVQKADGRQLLEEITPPHPPQQPLDTYSLVIGHATPMNGSVLLHLRLTHKSIAAHLHWHHKVDVATLSKALSEKKFEIKVEPGDQRIAVDTYRLLQHQQLVGDVLIKDLRDGVEYSFSTWVSDAAGVKQLSSRRTVQSTVGCFDPAIAQCCGHGQCVPGPPDSSGDAFCRCDTGFFGPTCSSFVTHNDKSSTGSSRLDTSVTCPAHFHHHVHILNSTSTVVPTHPTQLTATDYCPFSSLHNNAPQRTCFASIQMRLSQTTKSWAPENNLDAHYKRLATDLLIADISNALLSAPKSLRENSPSNIQASFGQSRLSIDDSVVLGPDIEDDSGGVCFTVYLQGSFETVHTQISSLLSQLREPSSVLRNGLVTGRLDPARTTVIAHRHPHVNPRELAGAVEHQRFRVFLHVLVVLLLLFSALYCVFSLSTRSASMVDTAKSVLRDKDDTAKS